MDNSAVFATVTTLIVGIVIFLWFKNGKQRSVLLEKPNVKYTVPLIGKKSLSWNVRRFRFGLPTKEHVLGVNPGQHIYLTAKVNNDLVIRPYSPVTGDDTKGYFDLVIKVYFKGQHPNHPNGGKMSQHLDSLKIGESIDIRGPDGNLIYTSKGNFLIKKTKSSPPDRYHYDKIGMIAGGTGLTPVLRILRELIKNPDDKTKVWLLFANNKTDDVMLKDELDDIQKNHPDQVKVWYTISKAEEGWQYSVGRVDETMIKEHLPPPADDTIILMCGPPPMIKTTCQPTLDKLSYSESKRYVF